MNGYAYRPARAYMRMVPHKVSLKLVKQETFESIHKIDIPTYYYYSFASYDDLLERMKRSKLLTGTTSWLAYIYENTTNLTFADYMSISDVLRI